MNDRLAFYAAPTKYINSYFDMIDCAEELGVSKIEMFSGFELEKPDVEVAKKIKEYADSKGVTFPCLSVYNCLERIGYEESFAKLKGFAKVAQILGSPYLHHTIIAEFSNPEKVLPYEGELLKSGIKLAKDVTEYAKDFGVKTAYEQQGFIFNGIKNLEILMDSLNGDAGIVMDFANFLQHSGKLEDYIRHFQNHIVHAHIKDAIVNDEEKYGNKALGGGYVHETIPMTGSVDVLANVKLMESLGYKACYSFEFGQTEENLDAITNAFTSVGNIL